MTSAEDTTALKDEEAAWVPIKFVPFSSAIESAFWVRYFREKLETIQLKEDAIPLCLFYVANPTTVNQPRLQCQDTSLLIPNERYTSSFSSNECVAVEGTLLGYNTLEAFQKADKNKLLRNLFATKFFASNESDMDDASVLNSLNGAVLITFADLKNHQVVYWLGMPVLSPQQSIVGRPLPFEPSLQGAAAMQQLLTSFESMRRSLLAKDADSVGLSPYFIYSPTKTTCWPLSKANYRLCVDSGDGCADGASTLVFGFVDPVGDNAALSSSSTNSSSNSSAVMMGWPMRNLIAYLSFHFNLGGTTVRLLSFRPQVVRRLAISSEGSEMSPAPATTTDSMAAAVPEQVDDVAAKRHVWISVRVPTRQDYEWPTVETPPQSSESQAPPLHTTSVATDNTDSTCENYNAYKVVGWELNARAKAGPRSVNLRPLLDPHHLAVQAADLNLKLMKWRMIPNLQVELLQSTKVLLLGAGTLGCNVARVLLGWGIRRFTIVDYGKVSYSNPVRQSLFTLDDCHADGGSGRSKAQAAADALKTIAADVHSVGITLSIPMPGHAETEESIRQSVETLDRLVQDADAVFLLTDTRESRWLPTVMASAHNKILINAALGLDSWLVMRHGETSSESNSSAPDDATVSLSSSHASNPRHGCYFCSDVVAPENSTRNRTLDQQCTVTRPGLALIASSMAVELLVAVLHHPLRLAAPAPAVKANNQNTFATVVSTQDEAATCPLGIIPHQIRGSLVTYTMMTPTIPAFQYCTGCSAAVVDVYRKDKVGIVLNCCRSADGSYLEEIAGLTAFRAESAETLVDVEGWDDDEE